MKSKTNESRNNIPEIDIELTSYTVKGGIYPLKMTVENMFGNDLKGKANLLWIWITSKRLRNEHKSFREYLDAPVTYIREYAQDMHSYQSIDATKELEEMLRKELDELNKD